MGAGFFRRFPAYPGNAVITQIEGTSVIDLPAPSPSSGVGTGTVCLAGEFSDMFSAVAVDGTGAVTTLCNPQQIFSAQDLLNKTGGFDVTIGDFGVSGGNGFVALRNKSYSALIVAVVNLCSGQGTRYFRQLPLCTTQTNPLPIVPVAGAVVAAGTQFKSPGGGTMNVGTRVIFTNLQQIGAGVGGATTTAASAATQPFTVAGANFATLVRPDGTLGVLAGDIVVIGNNNAGAIQPLATGGGQGGGTYRVQTAATSGSPTVLTLEQLDGSNFFFVTAATIPWRIHAGSDADSAPVIIRGNTVPGGYAAAGAGGYSIPARPITEDNGTQGADNLWANGEDLTPVVVPPALTGSSWAPLSGLFGRTHPTTGLQYTYLVQAPNKPANATLDALYSTAIAATVSANMPLQTIDMIFAARTSATIRNQLNQNAQNASAIANGRAAIIRPELSVVSTTAAVAAADPGVGANRAERVEYTWPGCQTYIPEAVGYNIACADGTVTNTGILDVGFDGYLAALESNLAPELNPGQAAQPVPQILASVLGFQRGLTAQLQLGDYIVLKASGVAALRMDASIGPVLQSGVTTSLVSGQTDINRRRFADFIEDSVAVVADVFSKLPQSQTNKDNMVLQLDQFMDGLLSTNNPQAQRINSYLIDDVSGNTPDLNAQNIFVVIVKVQMIPLANFIVIQTQVGNDVSTTAQLSGAT